MSSKARVALVDEEDLLEIAELARELMQDFNLPPGLAFERRRDIATKILNRCRAVVYDLDQIEIKNG